ncbi:EscF/YscF/HrpA family type III secretion system needle major subunit [Sansalvadorimonas sp. 2012CJ34-2]|uniref:EscF/YscF/HrpA family type III secretion system needle major subunit n=1 Tax=Parendozoicomonas callyspongiae TaxID=2942213 RepID=A0ABT0PC95_9GAMM|nr:EscF/YscF/HrpA family type III secretion system needle major subunit [Sansalvadorimonas sp. 2012CJ34-2]MCL6269004.1 EscF/YscF/HrpA family type III secretion system needle major subunit [Sansalvadorimonas sp. 2012CJ34-2]
MAQVSGSLNFENTTDRLSEKVSKYEDLVKNRMENLDPSNMAEMIQFQQEINKLTMLYSVQSGVTKSVKDTVMSIIQKIN